ncbi:MAG: heavy metal translocating P-type ATPase metal-binding domain-containing protein [Microscillaceae bacterium]|nr:heavy metal translocating P-type ATPase metal-binding domain-containing protein [Microscillaceae bacterium]MDW8459733.1 heavy metal translocating P-type ATPase metal-binding domain-containing protein [Cytophagales bacterium]
MLKTHVGTELKCYHCGDFCPDDSISIEDKHFCCYGCKTVYEILAERDLCTYYDLSENGKGGVGIKLKNRNFGEKFAFLDNPDIARKLLQFDSPELQKITLYLPAMHCSSCIWLLENLYKLREGIQFSRVNFVRKEITIAYNPKQISLRTIAELLTTLGYEPQINLQSLEQNQHKRTNRRLIYQIGVTGFCMGNIMLLSFPDYLVIYDKVEQLHKFLFLLLNVLLSLPVFFYGAVDYLTSAYKAIRSKNINLDVPISLGIVSLFGRSLYEIFTFTGVGYLDSLATLVFLLLVGKWFQQKTYASLSFERDYKSYFPLAVQIKNADNNSEKSTRLVTDLQKNDVIIIHHQELVPTDSILLSPQALIDYSFVTGESEPIVKHQGDYIYAGGRQMGTNIELAVQKSVSQSYLTQLWNSDTFQKNTSKEQINRTVKLFSVWFLYLTFAIALSAWAFWFVVDKSVMWNAFTAVLIVACPCALSLAMPFTFGNIIRILGKNQFYLKNIEVITRLASVNHIVFDKTGTLTCSQQSILQWVGEELNEDLKSYIKSACEQSIHPLSKRIAEFWAKVPTYPINQFKEIQGKGIEVEIEGNILQIGSAAWLNAQNWGRSETNTHVFVALNGEILGYFDFQQHYRSELPQVIQNLKAQGFTFSVVSGDKSVHRQKLIDFFGEDTPMLFEQKPEDKLNYIAKLQKQGKKVLMVGDGLNDAGALQQAEVGIALAEDTLAFSPACDAILAAEKLAFLPNFMRVARKSIWAVEMSFWLSIVYNFIGLAWAVSGNLSPLFAAVLMPISSISVVGLGVLLSSYIAQKAGLQTH